MSATTPAEADRDKQLRDDTITRLQAELDRTAAARAKAKTKKNDAAHHRAECALRDHPTLGRYLRQTKSRLQIDRAKIRAEERLDGKYLLLHQRPRTVRRRRRPRLKNLLEPERGFRDLKTTLELRFRSSWVNGCADCQGS